MIESTTIGLRFDYDCDGLSIEFFNLTNPQYEGMSFDDTMTRLDFDAKVLPNLDKWDFDYWMEEGYFIDKSGIRNCEIAQPTTPASIFWMKEDPCPVERGYF